MFGALMVGLSLAAQARIQRLEAQASRSGTFRRLLAETRRVPRRAGRLDDGAAVRYEPPPADRLVFDEKALAAADDAEVELEEARELARASMGLPVEVRDAELTAIQRELRVLLELRLRPSERDGGERGRAARWAALLAQDPRRFDADAGADWPPPGPSALKALEPSGGRARLREAVGLREDDAARLSKKLRQWLGKGS